MIDKILTKIIALRKQNNYTLENLAAELGIKISTYRKIEQNQTKLTMERFIKILKFYGVTFEDFFELNDASFGDEMKTLYYNNMELTKNYIESLKEENALLRRLVVTTFIDYTHTHTQMLGKTKKE